MKKSSSIFYLLSSIMSGVSGFLLISLLTKNFSPDSYGRYSLIITTVSLATTVQIGWISQSIIRFYDEFKRKNEENHVVNTMIISTMGMSLLLSAIAILYLAFKGFRVDAVELKFIILTLLLFLPESFYLVFNSILRANNNSRLYSISVMLYSALKLGLSFIAVTIGIENISVVIICYIISGIIVCSITFIRGLKGIKIHYRYFSNEVLKKFLKYGVSLIGLAAMQWIIASSDRYIISYSRSSDELGIYSLSYSLSTNIFNILTTFLLLVAYPKIISAYNKGGMDAAAKTTSLHLRNYYLILMPAFWGIAALSRDLIETFSSNEYLEGQFTLIITALSMLIYGLTFYYNKSWELSKNPQIIFWHCFYAGIANILLNLLLVPRFGYNAAAITTLFAYCFYLVITIYRSKKLMNIKLNFKSFIRITFASVLMYMTVRYFTAFVEETLANLVIAILLGGAIYTLLLWIFKEIDDEIHILKAKIREKVR